jgi:hypothetical protein
LDGTYGLLAAAARRTYDFSKTSLGIQIDPVKDLVVFP